MRIASKGLGDLAALMFVVPFNLIEAQRLKVGNDLPQVLRPLSRRGEAKLASFFGRMHLLVDGPIRQQNFD